MKVKTDLVCNKVEGYIQAFLNSLPTFFPSKTESSVVWLVGVVLFFMAAWFDGNFPLSFLNNRHKKRNSFLLALNGTHSLLTQTEITFLWAASNFQYLSHSLCIFTLHSRQLMQKCCFLLQIHSESSLGHRDTPVIPLVVISTQRRHVHCYFQQSQFKTAPKLRLAKTLFALITDFLKTHGNSKFQLKDIEAMMKYVKPELSKIQFSMASSSANINPHHSFKENRSSCKVHLSIQANSDSKKRSLPSDSQSLCHCFCKQCLFQSIHANGNYSFFNQTWKCIDSSYWWQ